MTSRRLYRILPVPSVSANRRSLRRRCPPVFLIFFNFNNLNRIFILAVLLHWYGVAKMEPCVCTCHATCAVARCTRTEWITHAASTASLEYNARPSHLLCHFSTSLPSKIDYHTQYSVMCMCLKLCYCKRKKREGTEWTCMQWMKKEKNECKTEKTNAINAKKTNKCILCMCK